MSMKNLPETNAIQSKNTRYAQKGRHSKIQKIDSHRHQNSKAPQNPVGQSNNNHAQNPPENPLENNFSLLQYETSNKKTRAYNNNRHQNLVLCHSLTIFIDY